MICLISHLLYFFFSSRRRHTRCALVTGVQTCALPICHRSRRRDAFYLCCRLAGGSDGNATLARPAEAGGVVRRRAMQGCFWGTAPRGGAADCHRAGARRIARQSVRSEEHTSELQSLMRISYAVFCLKKKKQNTRYTTYSTRYHQTTKLH